MTREVFAALATRLRSDTEFRQQLFAAPRATLAAYDLTEDEQAQLILPNFSWVVPGQVAGSARPMSDDALAVLAQHGVRALVTLTETPVAEESLLRTNLASVHVPVADFTAPTLAQVEEAVAAIDDFRARDLPVVVHCAAGIGRTGTVLACYLVSLGADPSAAIDQIREQRPGSIETPEQEAVVREYARQRDR